MSSEEKPPPGLTIDRAAFLLLRVKRAFKKKKQQRKEKSLISGENKGDLKQTGRPVENSGCCRPAPLLRSRTLPAIIVPGLSILQKQIDVCYTTSEIAGQTKVIQTTKKNSIDSSNIKVNKLIKPKILFTDETMVGNKTNQTVDNIINNEKFLDNFGKNHRLSSSNVLNVSGSQPMIKLSKLLNQKVNYRNKNEEIVRRLSWERRSDNDSSTTNSKQIDESWSSLPSVPRSGSIDSFICCTDWNVINTNSKNTIPSNNFHLYNWQKYGYGSDIKTEPCSPAPLRRSPSPSPSLTPTPLLKIRNDRQSLTSNIGKRIKGQRAIIELQSFQGMEFLEGFGKKKNHQLNHQINHLIVSTATNPLSIQPSLSAHLHALFTAIENGQLDKVKTLLESGEIDINSINNDGLSPLDVAVLNNNKALIKMLVANGAQEGDQFRTPETLGSHLASLMLTAEHKLGEVSGTGSPGTSTTSFLEAPNTRASFSATHNNLTGCGGNTEDKQVALWERRVRTLRKMLLGFDQARPPDVPFYISVDVIGIKSVLIRFQEAETNDSSICTKFKVQWSTKEDFSLITGEKDVLNMKQNECRIDGLIQGQRYYFRSCAGNLKGYSRFVPSSPTSVVPSSWRDIDGKQPRFAGRLEQLDSLFVDIKRPEYAQDTLALQRRNHKKKTTIKQLFTATSKFQKNLRRGVYFSCLLYHDDKILVTNEDFLPVIEVDETYPSCIYNDFHWLMKVACTWDNVKTLRQDMEKSHGSSTNHFRLKLLQAAAQMQAALCIQDLGQLYHKPIRDIQGTLVISTVNYIKSPKLVSVLNSRWLPLNKLTKKLIIHEDSNVSDLLISSIQEQMTYHQLSSIKLNKGLYLGYLKMQSSVDLIQIVVPAKAPNVLPHCKVRDNPHVSADEWNYLRKITRITRIMDKLDKDCYGYDEKEEHEQEKENNTTSTSTIGINFNDCQLPNEHEKLFVDLISATARRLFSYMEINHDDSLNHRLYDAEVIELTNDVSFLIIVPPAETACSVPGTREILLQRGDLLSIPIQVFEMVHLNAYQSDVINRYSKLSCILELDTAEAQHNHREAFSSLEMSVTKDKLNKLQDLQSQMNNIWKGARWLIDAITFARDRTTTTTTTSSTTSSSSSSSSQFILNNVTTTGISMKYLLNIERNNKTNGHSLKRTLLQLPPRDPKLVKSSPGRGSWPGPNLSNSTSNLLTVEFSKSEQQLSRDININNNTTLTDNELHCINEHARKGSDTSNLSTGSEPIKFSGLFLSDHLNKLPPSKSEDTLFLNHYKISNSSNNNNNNTRNRSATVTSASSNINKQLNVNPIIHGRSNTALSANNLTNTTSLLSFTSNNTSDSTQSLENDDYTPLSDSNIVNVKSTVQNKSKISKPTASVAAMASSTPIDNLEQHKDQKTSMAAPMPGILQVFAAYETGLASGTSLKLHVTPRTTARELVDLVVKQLNMAVVLKGQDGPIYTNDELPNFCLVAVIGARERCLRDDFKPLQLQNPWKKGRLYVRLKQDVLAALEHSSKHTAYL